MRISEPTQPFIRGPAPLRVFAVQGRYGNQWLAVRDEKVISSASDPATLCQRFKVAVRLSTPTRRTP